MSTMLDQLERANQILTYELFTIGNRGISLQSLVFFLVILGFTWLLSKYVRRSFDKRLASQFKDGTDHTLKRLLHYTILAIGLFVAIDFIGIDLTSLAVVASFLSVGIGFGLRNIASNFISGIILMFERPISVGDFIKVDDFLGTVQDIGLRATVFRTVDNQSIVIPNSTFLEQNVINWTRGESTVRLRFNVGVAYGSDVEKVKSTLIEAADALDTVREDPAPQVVFTEFGDSSLNFELRVWVGTAGDRIPVRDELNTKINELFAENELEMPFPQRDLHIRDSAPIEVNNPDSKSE
jgi:small-conductance mechanosensitive channel